MSYAYNPISILPSTGIHTRMSGNDRVCTV